MLQKMIALHILNFLFLQAFVNLVTGKLFNTFIHCSLYLASNLMHYTGAVLIRHHIDITISYTAWFNLLLGYQAI